MPCEAQAPEPPEAAPTWPLAVVFLVGFAAGAAVTSRLRRAAEGAAAGAAPAPPAVAPAPTPSPAAVPPLALTAGPTGPVTPSTRNGGGDQVPGHP